MRYLLAFIAYILLSVVVAWGLAIFIAWWAGMFMATMVIVILTIARLREIAENYILD